MSLANKRQAIRDFKREHPEASYEDLRIKFGCSYSTISDALRKKEPEEPSLLDIIAAKTPTRLTTTMALCPKTLDYITRQLEWAKRNKKYYLVSFLRECEKELAVVI